MFKLIPILILFAAFSTEATSLTCGVFEAGNIPTSSIFKNAKAACVLGEVAINQTSLGKNNRSLVHIDSCELNLSSNLPDSGYVRLLLIADGNTVAIDAFGKHTSLDATQGAFYLLNEVSLGTGSLVLRCSSSFSDAKAAIYSKGWHPGSKK